jgi:ribosomal protein S18 acetylase RimI-like enzyme
MLSDTPVELRRGQYLITTDRHRIDLDGALALLSDTHWGGSLTRDVLARAVANSLAFGLLEHDRVVGFGRAVTDLATYAYLTDVVVARAQRGQGLGRWLVECMLAHPELQGLRRVALLTRDARALYEHLGFVADAGDRTYMERR